MYCYDLISCNYYIFPPYPDITNLCSDILLPDDGQYVYLEDGRTYQLFFKGTGCVCEGEVPPYTPFGEISCNPYNIILQGTNCETGEVKGFGFVINNDEVGVKLLDDCSCWIMRGEAEQLDFVIDSNTNFEWHDECEGCVEEVGGCTVSERTFAPALQVVLPDPPIPDRGFEECCYDNLVLANLSSTNDWENDYNSFYFKKQLPSDQAIFLLIEVESGDEYDLDDDTYGQFWDFGDIQENPDLSIIRVDWKKVLADPSLGTGLYQIKTEVTIAGIPFEILSNTFHLEHFTHDLADKTIRIDSVMSGTLVHYDNINFNGAPFRDSLRVGGLFGFRSPKYTQDNLVKRNYDTVQISMSQENEYQFQTKLIPVCITKLIYDWHVFGDELYITDYNKANHSYEFLKFAVEFGGNKGEKYYANERTSRVNLTFKDRVKDKRKLNCN